MYCLNKRKSSGIAAFFAAVLFGETSRGGIIPDFNKVVDLIKD